MTEAYDQDLIVQGNEKLESGLVQLLITYRPYAMLLLKLDQVSIPGLDVRGQQVRAGVDLNNLYWNPVMAAGLSGKQVRGVLLHEAFHLILLHHARQKGRDPNLWNYVGDKKCNQFVAEVSESRLSLDVSDGVHCLDNEEKEMTTEQLYDKYMRENKGPRSTIMIRCTCGAGEDDGKGGKKECTCGAGEGSGLQEGQWDAPISGKDSPKGKEGKSGKPSDLDRQMWENRIRDFVEKSQGKMPASLRRELEGLLSPEIPWQEVLREYATECAAGMTDFTWKKFNRMYRMYDYFYPAMKGERVNVFLAADTSGSMGTQDLKRIFTEADEILQAYGDLHYMSCDAAIHGDPKRIDNLEELIASTVGGGGTDFRPVFEHVEVAQYMEEIPPVLIYMTDGYGTFPAHEPQYPVIWVMINSDVKPPFGKTVYVKHKGHQNNGW